EAATAVLNADRFATGPLADPDLDAVTELLRGLRDEG
ncbi:MAG: hypothetical protein QOG77_3091, partial [Solirubrobacteraceae bacterium]|nr:hypothetical protein [Solirubrobacteraceae bacterium]